MSAKEFILKNAAWRVTRELRGPVSQGTYRRELAELKEECVRVTLKTGKIGLGVLRITNPDGTSAEVNVGPVLPDASLS